MLLLLEFDACDFADWPILCVPALAHGLSMLTSEWPVALSTWWRVCRYHGLSQRPPSGRERVPSVPEQCDVRGDPRRAKSVKALEVRLNARVRRQSTRHSSPACTPVLTCEWRLHSTRPGRASYHTPRAPRVWRTAVTAGVEWRYASNGGSLGLCRSFLIMCDVLEPIGPLSGPVECVVLSE